MAKTKAAAFTFVCGPDDFLVGRLGKERFEALAAEARPGTPEELAAFVAGEIPKWQALAKLTGVTGE